MSAFSNAGQRCASASRIVVFDAVYEAFRERLVEVTRELEPEPVITETTREAIVTAVSAAVSHGATLLTGGRRLDRPGW